MLSIFLVCVFVSMHRIDKFFFLLLFLDKTGEVEFTSRALKILSFCNHHDNIDDCSLILT